MPKRALLLTLLAFSTAHAAETPALLTHMLPGEGKHLQAEAAKLIAEKTGRKVEDVSGIYYGLLPQFGLGVPESPPARWPAALQGDFEQARQVCKARLGKPAAGREAQTALIAVSGCTDKMRTGLWTRYLQQRKAEHLLELIVQPAKADTYRVSVSHVQPASDRRRSELATVSKAELDTTVKRLLTAVLAGEGQVQPARLDPELPAAPTANVSSVSKAETGLAAVPVPCSGSVPAAITPTPGSALAETIAARWMKSVESAGGQGAAPVQCAFQASEEATTDMMLGEMNVLNVILTCGGKQHRAMTALGIALRGRTAADVISERLLKNAFESYCGGK